MKTNLSAPADARPKHAPLGLLCITGSLLVKTASLYSQAADTGKERERGRPSLEASRQGERTQRRGLLAHIICFKTRAVIISLKQTFSGKGPNIYFQEMLREMSHRGRSLSPDFHLPRCGYDDPKVFADDGELDLQGRAKNRKK